MKDLNVAIRFLLELLALATLSYWGGTTGYGMAIRVILAIALPLVTAVFWGMFIAPRARVIVPMGVRMTLGYAVFTCAGLALADRGHLIFATIYVAAAAINVVLMAVWKQDRVVSHRSV